MPKRITSETAAQAKDLEDWARSCLKYSPYAVFQNTGPHSWMANAIKLLQDIATIEP